MDSFEEKIRHLIEPICEEEAIYLYSVSVHHESRRQVIKIIADTDSGITLNQCQQLSKKVSDVFYRKDLFQKDYRLEVSSPGINKPLVKPFEFRRNIGRVLKVNYREGEETKSIVGELVSFDDELITIRHKNDEIGIPLTTLEQAKIKLKW
jgi:ribosome maturation factor RimP